VLARRGQLTALLLDLAIPLLQLGKQAHILDGDDRLIRKRLKQLNLLVGEGRDPAPPEIDDSDDRLIPQHRNRQEGSKAR
jgi:hypothetical protein